MTKFQVKYTCSDGEVDYGNELFDTEEEAREAGEYGCSCCPQGNEILNMSNPGDYPLSNDDDIDFEIVAVDE